MNTLPSPSPPQEQPEQPAPKPVQPSTQNSAQKPAPPPQPTHKAVKQPPPKAPTPTIASPVSQKAKSKISIDKFLQSIRTFGLRKQQAQFIDNMAILLKAGLPIRQAMETVARDTYSGTMKKLLHNVSVSIERGMPLWQSLASQGALPRYAVAILRVGEETGSLAKSLEYLSVQQEKDRALKRQVVMAMFYPTIVLVLALFVLTAMAIFVLPQLVGVLTSLNADLPFSTRMIIAVSGFSSAHGTSIIFGMTIGLLVAFILIKYSPLKVPAQALFLRIPAFGKLAQAGLVARSGIILGTLLKAGIPPVEALRYLADSLDFVLYKKFYRHVADMVDDGKSFRTAFDSTKMTGRCLPAAAQQLILTGEESGLMSDMFMQVAGVYEKRAQEMAQVLPIVLEPLLLFFIAGIVGLIAYSVIVPIYSVVQNIN